MKNHKIIRRALSLTVALFGAAALASSPAFAACPFGGITNGTLTPALQAAVTAGGGGFGFNMWATIVDRDGVVCVVAKSGAAGTQWPGSRVISAQKANTANSFSLPTFALSTANLWAATQPGGSLFALQESNPVDTAVAYVGSAATWGTAGDELVDEKIGGVNVFGGGLALYDAGGTLLGAIGVSGDSSCADHNIAWLTRENLAGFGAANVPAGVGPNGKDGINYDLVSTSPGRSRSGFAHLVSAGGFGHPECGLNGKSVAIDIGSGG